MVGVRLEDDIFCKSRPWPWWYFLGRLNRYDTIKAGQTEEQNYGEHASKSGICEKATSRSYLTSVCLS
jgi:hypothetical protein